MLRKGATVRDDIFGNGIATGTVPCVGGGPDQSSVPFGKTCHSRSVAFCACQIKIGFPVFLGGFGEGSRKGQRRFSEGSAKVLGES